MLRTPKFGLSVITAKHLYCMLARPQGQCVTVAQIPLEDSENAPLSIEPAPFYAPRGFENRLLIVPDHWISIATYDFQSTNPRLAEAFIARKLQSENPDLEGIENLFSYRTIAGTKDGPQRLNVSFLQKSGFNSFYKTLKKSHCNPGRITSPARIWEYILQTNIPDCANTPTGLVHLQEDICFLYFYNNGRFLFSRQIALPGGADHQQERISSLTFEINQSLYLFSQKAKTEISTIHLIPSTLSNADSLGELLGRRVLPFNHPRKATFANAENRADFIALSHFSIQDIAPNRITTAIAHRQEKHELAWKPVQAIAIFVGLIFFLLLATEGLLLNRRIQATAATQKNALTAGDPTYNTRLQEYTQALEFLIAQQKRPSVETVLPKIANSLPPGVRIQKMAIQTEPDAAVTFEGVVKAKNPNDLNRQLISMIQNLNQRLAKATPINMEDIDLRKTKQESQAQTGYYLYAIKFILKLS